MIQAFTHDIQRLIEVTPVQDVEGEPVVAKVYREGCFMGIANTVRPGEDAGQVALQLQNDRSGGQSVAVTISGKNRFEDQYVDLKQQTLSVPGQSASNQTIAFDPQDYDEFRVQFGGNAVDVTSVAVIKRQYETADGVVIGGQANEKIVIPCDFRGFPPGEDYRIVFVAENTGVVGREMLNLFGKDGYSFEDKPCTDESN